MKEGLPRGTEESKRDDARSKLESKYTSKEKRTKDKMKKE